MNHPAAIERLRWAVRSPADAIRFACILEATAPKPGNVHPAAAFADLEFADFVLAAECAAVELTRTGSLLGERIYQTIAKTRLHTGTNVNLGIVLLIAPLVVAAESGQSVASLLAHLPAEQGRRIGEAIALASPGGMDSAPPDDPTLDVRESIDAQFDLMAGMRIAAPRDAIAAQYIGGFTDLLDHIVPRLQHHINSTGDILGGIVHAAVELLAERGDSLIARKQGDDAVRRAQAAAKEVVDDGFRNLAKLDALLRCDGHQLNPGTTADLIAAALYVSLSRSALPLPPSNR